MELEVNFQDIDVVVAEVSTDKLVDIVLMISFEVVGSLRNSANSIIYLTDAIACPAIGICFSWAASRSCQFFTL
ncbi:hypothetical protein F7734_50690 [Scytonema sp. UIC 10036]|uniref:hypothetical protein n=1 Tax=Scytonema sp. UIC 10036 TaxID=2304196 RepID=UPI0012DA0619|nr:hypothetical protein [Scytonema sp. UIC 10036]MUH00108.1 hypothetical protein [Scytonema sp. UIC 10036]